MHSMRTKEVELADAAEPMLEAGLVTAVAADDKALRVLPSTHTGTI